MSYSLPAIAALARTGALQRGWELFESGGYLANMDDPAALAVKGRLLKAKARLAKGTDRSALMAEAADAYSAANALTPEPYLAINAATLRLLAGADKAANAGADHVLAMLDGPETPADTPYYLAATRAEALLLRGETDAARASLIQAVQHDPDGWSERATTIAQLREILAEQGGDSTWLGEFSPPPSLHFAGHMGFAADGVSQRALNLALDELLSQVRPGFAWGALAAGADIIIAERLLALDCEIHAVLPCPPDDFEAQSVAPAGAEWLKRYRDVLARCTSVCFAGPSAASVHDPLATLLAGELAIGGAVLQAKRFGTDLLQLIVEDENGGGQNTAMQARLWRKELGAQHVSTVARDASVEAMFPPEVPDPARQLVLLAAIGQDELEQPEEIASTAIETVSSPITRALESLPPGAVRAGPGLWEFVVPEIDLGLSALTQTLKDCRQAGVPVPSIGVHLAICNVVADPASGAAVPYGSAPKLARLLMQFAPRGVILASDPLAVTLAARGGSPLRSEVYLPDEPTLGGSAHVLLDQ